MTQRPAFGSSGFTARLGDSSIPFYFKDSFVDASFGSKSQSAPIAQLNRLFNSVVQPGVEHKSLEVTSLSCESIWDSSNRWDAVNISINIKNSIDFNNDTFRKSLSFSNMRCEAIHIVHGMVHDLSFRDATFNRLLSLDNCKISGIVLFDDTVLPKYLSLTNLDLTELERPIDLTKANARNDLCILDLTNTDLSKIKFNLRNFQISFPSHYDENSKENFYSNLLKKCRDEGAEENVKWADILYKRFIYERNHSYIKNFFDEHWWHYGYDKTLIIRNSAVLFLLFFVINLFRYRLLLFHVYKVDTLLKKYTTLSPSISYWQAYIKRVVDVFLYTSLIFWSVKLEWKELEISRYVLLLYVLFQYLIGLICLSYIATLILTK